MQDHNKSLNQYFKRSATLVAAFMMLSFTTFGYASVITTGCSEATSCTLEELFAGGSITVNDKVFENWEGFIIQDPDYSQIVVTGLDDGGNDPGPGLRFDLNGQFSYMNDEFTDESERDWNILFDVATTGGVATIIGNSLTLIDFQIFGPDYLSEVEIIQGGSYGDDLGVWTESLFDSISFDPQSRIRINTELRIFAFGQLGGASIDSFETRFSQVIPVPPALWLFGSGLLGLVGIARRKKAA